MQDRPIRLGELKFVYKKKKNLIVIFVLQKQSSPRALVGYVFAQTRYEGCPVAFFVEHHLFPVPSFLYRKKLQTVCHEIVIYFHRLVPGTCQTVVVSITAGGGGWFWVIWQGLGNVFSPSTLQFVSICCFYHIWPFCPCVICGPQVIVIKSVN